MLYNGIKYNTEEIVYITIEYQLLEGFHHFEIKDNGIGIAPEFREKIFGMFKRLNNRSDYMRSGLGLSITQKMMSKLNGEITVLHSQENKGSTFRLKFPTVTDVVPDLTKVKLDR